MRIVVVGGVAGGMSCAARARRLDEDAQIVVLEAGEHVSFANCGLPYYVGGEIDDEQRLLVQTPASLRASLNLDVRTRSEVIGLDTARHSVSVRSAGATTQLTYDALVLAPGAVALRPPIDGLDSPRVRTLRTVDDAIDLQAIVSGGARHGVVLGAGFIGLEAAEALARQGLDVTVVELAEHVLPPLETETAHYVTAELRRLGVTVRAGIGATRIEHNEDRDTVVLTDGTRLPADVVVASLGVRPDTEVFEAAGISCERGAIVVDEHGRTSIPDVWAVGDAVVSIDAVTGARFRLRWQAQLTGPVDRSPTTSSVPPARERFPPRWAPRSFGWANSPPPLPAQTESPSMMRESTTRRFICTPINTQDTSLEQCRCTWWCTWPHPMDDYSALKPWAVMASTNVSTCLPPRFEPDYVFPI